MKLPIAGSSGLWLIVKIFGMIRKGDMFAMVMDFCAILGSGSLLASGEGMYCVICCHAHSI